MSGVVDKFPHTLSRHGQGQGQLFLLSQLKSEWLSWYGVCAAGRSTVQYNTVQCSLGSIPRCDFKFVSPKTSRPAVGLIQYTVQCTPGNLFSESKLPGHQTNAKIEERRSTPSQRNLSARCGLQCQSIRF